ncbi:MAG: hypothetical protein H6782_04150 [Candidatus Nomurabacteria bacterium]|nr:MAG: hypothetical protein H6782_04150 [Candidatus Nomurabacteria bacterium]
MKMEIALPLSLISLLLSVLLIMLLWRSKGWKMLIVIMIVPVTITGYFIFETVSELWVLSSWEWK